MKPQTLKKDEINIVKQSLKSSLFNTSLFLLIGYILIWVLKNDSNFYLLNKLQFVIPSLFVFSVFFNTEKSRLNISWWVYILLFSLIAFLSTHASVEYGLASNKISLDGHIIALGFLIYVIYFKELPNLAKPILLLVVLVFVVCSLPTTLVEIITQIPEDNHELWLTGFKLTSSFDLSYYTHIRHFSYHAFISCCCAVILVQQSENRLQKTIFLFLASFCVFAMLLAYGRGSILAFIAFIAINSFYAGGYIKACKNVLLTLSIILTTYVILYFTSAGVISEFLLSSFVKKMGQEVGTSANSISSGRLEMWLYGIRSTLESPIYGHGSGSAYWVFRESVHSYAAQPHNSVVQFIMDFGFLGAAVLCFIFFKMLKPFYTKYQSVDEHEMMRRSLASFVAAYILFSFTDGLFYHTFPLIHFSIIIALLCSLQSRNSLNKN